MIEHIKNIQTLCITSSYTQRELEGKEIVKILVSREQVLFFFGGGGEGVYFLETVKGTLIRNKQIISKITICRFVFAVSNAKILTFLFTLLIKLCRWGFCFSCSF